MSIRTKTADASELVSLADEEGVKQILVGTVYGLWDIVNNLTRLRPSKRDHYRVSIFGSARVNENSPVYKEVTKLAAALAALDCDIVTGGGPGLMQAANEGAKSAQAPGREKSVGIRIKLPFEQNVNKYVEKAYEHQTFFTRLHHFALASDAFVVVPGGIGTALETLMVWQLLQVKHLPPMPLVLIGEIYREFVDWASKHMMSFEPPLASPEDFLIPKCVRTVDEAVDIIKKDMATWSEKLEHR